MAGEKSVVMSEDDAKLWKRIIDNRLQKFDEAKNNSEPELEKCLSKACEELHQTNSVPPKSNLKKIEWLLSHHLKIAIDGNAKSELRRKSLGCIQSLLRVIDDTVEKNNATESLRPPTPPSISSNQNKAQQTNDKAEKENVNSDHSSTGPTRGYHISTSNTTNADVRPSVSSNEEPQTNGESHSLGKRKFTSMASEETLVSPVMAQKSVAENGTSISVRDSSEKSSQSTPYSSLGTVLENGSKKTQSHHSDAPPSINQLGGDEFIKLKSIENKVYTYTCSLCICGDMAASNIRSHVRGKQHQKQLTNQRSNSATTAAESYYAPSQQTRPAAPWSPRSAGNRSLIQPSHLLHNHPLPNLDGTNRAFMPPAASLSRIASENGNQQQAQLSQNGRRFSSGDSDRARVPPPPPPPPVGFPGHRVAPDSWDQNRFPYQRPGAATTPTLPVDRNRLNATTDISSRTRNASRQQNEVSNNVGQPNIPAREEPRRNNPQFIPLQPITIIAAKDLSPTAARTLEERDRTEVTFPQLIPGPDTSHAVGARLREWDPFWRQNLDIVAIGVTSKVTKSRPLTQIIQRAVKIDLDFNRRPEILSMNLAWGSIQPSGENRQALILRMIPLDENYHKNMRADYHIWPKGTFLQVNDKPVTLNQRKQQEHDRKKWTGGICRDLDLLEHIPNPRKRSSISIFTYDPEVFAVIVSVSEFRSVPTLYKTVMDPNSHEAITIVSKTAALRKALGFASGQMLVLDSDDEDNEDVGKFIFSLTCPISKQIMKTPVRGKHCKHWQCYDLENYLSSNQYVYGSRWRCASCESFVSLSQLEYCGLTADLLKEFKNSATPNRDRVEFRSDKTYTLLPEKQSKYKRRAAAASNGVKTAQTSNPSAEQLVIDLL